MKTRWLNAWTIFGRYLILLDVGVGAEQAEKTRGTDEIRASLKFVKEQPAYEPIWSKLQTPLMQEVVSAVQRRLASSSADQIGDSKCGHATDILNDEQVPRIQLADGLDTLPSVRYVSAIMTMDVAEVLKDSLEHMNEAAQVWPPGAAEQNSQRVGKWISQMTLALEFTGDVWSAYTYALMKTAGLAIPAADGIDDADYVLEFVQHRHPSEYIQTATKCESVFGLIMEEELIVEVM